MQTKVTEKLKGFWEKVKGAFKKLNKVARILLGVGAVVILVAIIALVLQMNKKEYAVLYTDLSASDTTTILQYLNDNGITDYQLRGNTILVPAGREGQLQAQLALAGYPTSGFLYEWYTQNTGNISTDNERDRAFLVATQERLGAIIRQFEGVQEAWVNIEPGTERVYVLDPNTTPATASVTITPKDGKLLDSNVVAAIRRVVSHSVQNLDISNVTVEDTMGNPYNDNNVMDDISDANAMKLQFEQETNNQLRTNVYNALRDIYGDDNVRVTARCTANVDRRVIESTEYHQPAGSVEGGGLIGTQKWFWEYITDGTEPVGGTVGTTTNSNLPIYPDLEPNLNGNENYAGAQGEQEGKIDTTVTQREGLAATITDVSIGVTINGNCANANSLSAEAVRSHVATVAGIRSDDLENYVSVIIAPFDNTVPYDPNGQSGNTDQILPGVPNWVLLAAIGGLLLFIILLILILILRSRAKKKRLAQQKALEEEMQAAEALAAAALAAEAPAPTGGADIMEINTEKSMELRKTVRQFAQNNPEIAAQMVKAWLRGGDEDNG